MHKRLIDACERGLRMITTAACFAGFGVGALALWFVVFPVLRWQYPDRTRSTLACRRAIKKALRLLTASMVSLRIVRLEVVGAEKLQRPNLLILANHPSLIDVVFLLALTGPVNCIVKGALARNPFTRGPVRSAGYVLNDDGAVLVERCVEALQSGDSLIVFPEGTRTVPGEMPKLRRGAANIALQSRCDVTPVRIECDPPMLTKGARWYAVPRVPSRFVITVYDDVAVDPFVRSSRARPLAARDLNQTVLETIFGGCTA